MPDNYSFFSNSGDRNAVMDGGASITSVQPQLQINLSYNELKKLIETKHHYTEFPSLIEKIIELRLIHRQVLDPDNKIDRILKEMIGKVQCVQLDLKEKIILPFIYNFALYLELNKEYDDAKTEKALHAILSVFGNCFHKDHFRSLGEEKVYLKALIAWSPETLYAELQKEDTLQKIDSSMLKLVYYVRKKMLQQNLNVILYQKNLLEEYAVKETEYIAAREACIREIYQDEIAYPDLTKVESMMLLFLFPEYSARILPWLLYLGSIKEMLEAVLPSVDRGSIEYFWESNDLYFNFDDLYKDIVSLLKDIRTIGEKLQGKASIFDLAEGESVSPYATPEDAKSNNELLRSYIQQDKSVLYLNGLYGYLSAKEEFNIHRHRTLDRVLGITRINALEETIRHLQKNILEAMRRELSEAYLWKNLKPKIAGHAIEDDGKIRRFKSMRQKKIAKFSQLKIVYDTPYHGLIRKKITRFNLKKEVENLAKEEHNFHGAAIRNRL